MTFPIRTISDLFYAITLDDVAADTAIVVVTREGTRLQIDGVKLMRDAQERQVEFQLNVGPPDAPWSKAADKLISEHPEVDAP